jgi:hypothetical protein
MWYKWSGGEVCIGFWWGNLKEREHFEDLGINGRVILKLIIRKSDGRVCVIDLVQGIDNWWGALNVVMSLHVPTRHVISSLDQTVSFWNTLLHMVKSVICLVC